MRHGRSCRVEWMSPYLETIKSFYAKQTILTELKQLGYIDDDVERFEADAHPVSPVPAIAGEDPDDDAEAEEESEEEGEQRVVLDFKHPTGRPKS